ncbi:hypothetical protein ACFW1A_22590 [Kitasatospora sp. NPDC058965]|uniref:hypothetical protein n=1 Tax=Kitasatospora sp. NPDC058965 TaxID=3346682 RepID=UPI0036CEFC1B
MTTSLPTPVLHFDLRTDPWDPDDPDGLRLALDTRLAALGPDRGPDGDDQRILVVDTPAGLMLRQRHYEQLLGSRRHRGVRLLCLLTGPLPPAVPDPAAPDFGERVLVFPSLLRQAEVGLLWAGDLMAGPPGYRGAPDDPQALALLVDLLLAPELFDQVLAALRAGGEAAAPALRVLAHDLSPQARGLAWSQALLRFAGSHQGGPTGSASRRPAEPALLGELRAGGPGGRRAGRAHRIPNGPAARAHGDCTAALRAAELALDRFGGPGGLLGGAGRSEFEQCVQQAEEALDRLRDCAERAVRADQGPGTTQTAAELTDLLDRLGLAVEPVQTSKERIGGGLRDYARALLTEGLSLRAAAEHFTQLASQVGPLPVGRLHRELTGLRRRPAAAAEPDRTPELAPAAVGLLSGALAALWSLPLALLGLLVPVLLAVASVAAGDRLRESLGGRQRAVRLGAAGLVGAVLGALVGGLARPPAAVGALGLVLGLALTTGALLRAWQRRARRWGLAVLTPVHDELTGVDELLRQLTEECWAVEERRYTADAANAVVGVLRAAALAAEREAALGDAPPAPTVPGPPPGPAPQPGDPADDWDWVGEESRVDLRVVDAPAPPRESGPEDTAAGPDPRWLLRYSSEGGPELVATLARDLADATVTALEPYWRAMTLGRTTRQSEQRTADRVGELLALARRHLQRNGVLSAPPFAQPERGERADPAGLLGLDIQQVADLAGPFADRRTVVELTGEEQHRLLSPALDRVGWLHFAPAALHPAIREVTGGAALREGSEVWTGSSRYAGLIKLVPLRPDALRAVRRREDGSGSAGGYGW